MKEFLLGYRFVDAVSLHNATAALEDTPPSAILISGPQHSGKTRLAKQILSRFGFKDIEPTPWHKRTSREEVQRLGHTHGYVLADIRNDKALKRQALIDHLDSKASKCFTVITTLVPADDILPSLRRRCRFIRLKEFRKESVA